MAFRSALTIAAAVLLAAMWQSAIGQDKDAAGKKELEEFQGVWNFTSVEQDGQQKLSKDQPRIITFKGDTFTVKTGDMVLQAGTHKMDPTTKPKAVDAKITEGEGQGNTMLGIYEFEGDTLKACFDPLCKKRPTEFKAPAGSGFMLAIVKREKK